MSDRIILAIAAVPMLSGAALLLALQRPAAMDLPGMELGPESTLTYQPTASEGAGWTGVIVAGESADLAAEAGGSVLQVLLRAGTRVERDQPILHIDQTDADNSVGQADAELQRALSDAERARARLHDAGRKLERVASAASWIADQEIESTRAAARVASAELRAARAAVRLSRSRLARERSHAARLTLRAPFAGVLVSCDVDSGDTVAPGQVLARVITDERLVRFAASPQALSDLRHQRLVVRRPDAQALVLSVVSSIEPEVDPATHLVFATASLDLSSTSSDHWLPGTRVQVIAERAPDARPK